MTSRVDSLIHQIRELEHELAAEFSRQRSGFRFGLEHGRARFEEEAVRRGEPAQLAAIHGKLPALDQALVAAFQ